MGMPGAAGMGVCVLDGVWDVLGGLGISTKAMLASVGVAGAAQLENRRAQTMAIKSIREEFTKVSGRELSRGVYHVSKKYMPFRCKKVACPSFSNTTMARTEAYNK